MNRLLTRRDKTGQHKRSRSADPTKQKEATGILSLFKPDALRKPTTAANSKEGEVARKVQALKQRVELAKMPPIEEQQIEYALLTKFADGDTDKAFELLVLFQESVEGIVRPYNADVYMKGAENRAAVTCYLDSLLFAMFARLGSFEPILYTTFDDEPRRRLSTLIRLWVNMLRSGKLIQTDITKLLQEALRDCGWAEAAKLEQQDTSEAFGFITEKLELPLLTLEMDIFHEGGADDKDDHKFVKERLLEVAVPAAPANGQPVQLEDCLEDHFNTRVEVVRRLERRDTLQRSNTRGSTISSLSKVDEKSSASDHVEEAVHIEHADTVAPIVGKLSECSSEDNEGPISLGKEATPILLEPSHLPEIQDTGCENIEITSQIPEEPIHVRTVEVTESVVSTPSITTPITPTTPTLARTRAPSIIRRRLIQDDGGEGPSDGGSIRSTTKRKASIRKEVLMPAWQFFRIIPWYTTNVPANDSQVAAHFSSTRPVLGICLKRYAMDNRGHPIRQNTKIDIPLQIALPHFIRDDKSGDGAPVFGNFNLVLQSMVCHRGTSVHAGHYVSIIRGGSQNKDQMPDPKDGSDSPPEYAEDKWIKFDDLASERVSYVNIEEVLENEMPYLLFYQVQPLFEDETMDQTKARPPSYEDSAIGMVVQEPSPVAQSVGEAIGFPARTSYFDGNGSASNVLEPKGRISFSDDMERPRKSLSISDAERRGSLAFTDMSNASTMTTSQPVTPGEEIPPTTATGRLSRAASRFTRSGKSKSRPTSVVDEQRNGSATENRISASFAKLNLMRSKEALRMTPDMPASSTDIIVSVTSADDIAESRRQSLTIAPSEASSEPEQQTAEPKVAVISSSTAPAPVGKIEGGGVSTWGIGGNKSHAKKGKEKSIDVDSQGQHHHHLHHHSHSKDKGKGKAKDGEPDRECILM